jgi:hypothetical protein
MRTRGFAANLLLAATFAGNATATSTGASQLNIRQMGDAPAACLPESERDSIELESAHVTWTSRATGARAGGHPPVHYPWAIDLIPDTKPLVLHPGECIVFGERIAGYKQDGEIQPLQIGETYSFVLRRYTQHNSWLNPYYRGAFCVARSPDGHLAYLPYIYNSNGTITYPSCGRYAGLPPAPDGASPPPPASSYPISTKP